MDSVAALPKAWRDEANTIRERYGDESLAKLCETHARELAEALKAADEQLLTPAQAAADPEILWDSADHVSLQVRTGRIRNYGRKGNPLVRRGDLPKKPTPRAEAESSQPNGDEAPLDDFSRRALARTSSTRRG